MQLFKRGGAVAVIMLSVIASLPARADAAVLSVTSVWPSAKPVGSPQFHMDVTGTGFVSGATVSISGGGVSTMGSTVMAETYIGVQVTVAADAAPGARDVVVTQPGGSATCAGCFTVNARPAPSAVSPNTVPQGGSVEVVIDGSGFQPAASLHCGPGFCPSVAQSTFESPNRIRARVGADVDAALGTRDLTVQNPDGGTGTCTACFSVIPGPKVLSVSPETVTRGESAVITVTGTNFQPGITAFVSENCCNRLKLDWLTRDSDTQVRVGVTVPERVHAGEDAFFLRNPDSGTIGAAVTVTAPPVVITSVSAGARDLRRGESGAVFTIKGSGFVDTPVVSVSDGISTARVQRVAKDELRVSVNVPQGMRLGPVDIGVGNFDFTGTTCTGCGAVVPQAYWMVASDGGVFAFGNAPYHGSMGGRHLNQPIVGMASTPDGQGYWLVASDGGMFSFNAPFFGSMGGQHLNKPIVGMAPTKSGRGYWLVASDGGMFAYGDAGFYGSMGGRHLNKPIVAMAPTPTGNGYWLVASDGGMFAFGDAEFRGSVVDKGATRPVVGMAASASGRGYFMATDDGSVYAFGDYYLGSLHPKPIANRTGPMVAMGPIEVSGGYRLAAADGTVYGLYLDDSTGLRGHTLNRPIVGMAMQGPVP